MMNNCERVEIEATVKVTFVGCRDHGHFDATSILVDTIGVDSMDMADALFSAIEEMLTMRISRASKVEDFVAQKHEWMWTEEGAEPLPERAQKHLLNLLAHQLMLGRVASRSYGRVTGSAMLVIPPLD